MSEQRDGGGARETQESEARHVRYTNLSIMGRDDSALYKQEISGLSSLWGKGCKNLRSLADFREFRSRHGHQTKRTNTRSLPESSRQLRARELPMGNSFTATNKSTEDKRWAQKQ